VTVIVFLYFFRLYCIIVLMFFHVVYVDPVLFSNWYVCYTELNRTAEISASGITPGSVTTDHGYSRCGIFVGSVLRLYRTVRTSYAARSASFATTTLLVVNS